MTTTAQTTNASTLIEDRIKTIQETELTDSKAEAFAQWFLGERFNMTKSDIQDTLIMAGKGGKGIDAVFFEEDDARINVLQFHYGQGASAVFDREAFTALEATLEHLSEESTIESQLPPSLRQPLRELHERRKAEYGTVLYLVVWGEFEKEVAAEIDRRNDAPENEGIAILRVDKHQLLELLPTLRDVPEIDAEIPIYKNEFMQHEQRGRKSLVISVRAKDVGMLRREHSDNLFSKNVRYYLGNKGANKGMLDSLRTDDGKQNYWFYHNGITGICDSYEIVDGAVRAKNLQIVNGCQTTVTLDDAMTYYDREDVDAEDRSPTLLMRLIETGDDSELLTKISKYTNTQSAVTDQDLASNDRIQEHIQAQFSHIGYFYERARGEWKTLSPAEKMEYRDERERDRLVINSDVAKSIMIWIGLPAEAKSEKKKHFVRKPLGGYYETIFDTHRDVWEYLLAHKVMEFAESRKKDFKAELKNAQKSEYAGLSDEDREVLRAREYLLHAETHVAAFIGSTIRDKVSPTHYKKVVHAFETENLDAIQYIFRIMDRIMVSYYKERLRGEGIQFSKHFKNRPAWNEFRSHIKSQMEVLATIGGNDPLDGFIDRLHKAGVPA